MTLKEAVQVLNERRHRGASDWLISGTQVTGSEPFRVVCKEMDPKNLTAFEAIAKPLFDDLFATSKNLLFLGGELLRHALVLPGTSQVLGTPEILDVNEEVQLTMLYSPNAERNYSRPKPRVSTHYGNATSKE